MGNVISWAAVENLVTGVPADEADRQVTTSPSGRPHPFWARLSSEISRQPLRVIAAGLATVLGPTVVAHAGSLSPAAVAAPRAQIAASPRSPPGPGDTAGWLATARAAAGTCPGLSSSVLVAIGEVESALGTLSATSAAGAEGPMQFLPSTWAVYGTDADGDGLADVMNPVDAIHAAARLLCANGGADPERLPSALWNYNHSEAYVRQVLGVARFVPTGT